MTRIEKRDFPCECALCALCTSLTHRPRVRFAVRQHCLVVLGHLASMSLDLVDISAPVARVGADLWAHTAAPLSNAALPLVLAPWLMLFALLPNKRRLFNKVGKLAGRKQGKEGK
jgi:hypothetical protein